MVNWGVVTDWTGYCRVQNQHQVPFHTASFDCCVFVTGTVSLHALLSQFTNYYVSVGASLWNSLAIEAEKLSGYEVFDVE